MKHKIFALIEKCLKVVPVLMVYFLVSTITYSYIRYYTFDKNSEFTCCKGFLLIIGILFLIMMLICHTLCIIVSPGLADQSKLIEISKKADFYDYQDKTKVDFDEAESFCKKCEKFRPIRSHHCKTCNKCILKMDHHCPWIANCVGYDNHKYFLLFLLYTILGSTLAFCGLATKFYEVDGKLSYYFAFYKFILKLFITFEDANSDNSLKNKMDPVLPTNTTNFPIDHIGSLITYDNPSFDPVLILISTLMSLFTIVGVTTLFSFQIYLISNNLSGIEYHKYRPKECSPHYNANSLQNIKNLLGENFISWLLPRFYSSKHDEEYLNVKPKKLIIL